MKAMVLAAGVGTRLRPLTFHLPKPMIPIVNKPVLEHTIENLRKHGILQVALNLHTYPALIRKHFGDGSRYGMAIRYSPERRLLGTAGAVKRLEKYFDRTFFVLSGDGLSDVNLTKALLFHRQKRAFATIVLARVDARFDYGVTRIDEHARVKDFIEKPRWSDMACDTVNTGIYIFEPGIFAHIPRDKFYDFGHQVWQNLIRAGKRVYGYVTRDYWCDVGNLGEYRRSQRDVLDRRVSVLMPGDELKPGVWVGTGTVIERGARLCGPCVIGKHCRIGSRAVIGRYTTVGDRSVVGPGAVLKDCIIWNGVTVEKNVILTNCVISRGAHVTESISVFEGAVITVKRKG